jgi:hypothetical protein
MSTVPDPSLIGPKAGIRTTEFWVVIFTALMPALTLISHKDFSSSVQSWATAAAGLATVVYVLSRSLVKSSYAKAQLAPVAPAPTPSPALAAAATPAAPVDLTALEAAQNSSKEIADELEAVVQRLRASNGTVTARS